MNLADLPERHAPIEQRVRANGTALEIRGMPLPGGGFVTIYIDITERKKMEEQVHQLAFYDALEVNDSAVKVLGEPTLVHIARELVETVKKNVTIDWTMRENVRAQLRVIVKRILRKYGYPPDKQEKATQTVLEQAELLTEAWAVA